MTQEKFSNLIYEWGETDDENRKSEIESIISRYRQRNANHLLIGRFGDNIGILVTRIIGDSMFGGDDCSPDSVSFDHDFYIFNSKNELVTENCGCYWGYISIWDMLFDLGYNPLSMYITKDHWIDNMAFSLNFDYDYVDKLLKQYEGVNIRK